MNLMHAQQGCVIDALNVECPVYASSMAVSCLNATKVSIKETRLQKAVHCAPRSHTGRGQRMRFAHRRHNVFLAVCIDGVRSGVSQWRSDVCQKRHEGSRSAPGKPHHHDIIAPRLMHRGIALIPTPTEHKTNFTQRVILKSTSAQFSHVHQIYI